MSADQEFKQLIRSLYAYLRAFHHARTLQEGAEQNKTPRRLERIAGTLTTAIKPALSKQSQTTGM